jgi:uncharacterized protein (TIGR02270 family)
MVHEVVADHAEMASFLWELREMAVRSHHYTLADLAELEERVEAHLDGLRIAGEPGWELTLAALSTKDPGAFFAAAIAAVEARDYPGFAAVLDATEEADEPAAGVAGALAWASPADAFAIVAPMLSGAQPPALRRLALAACVAHRRDPGQFLGYALCDGDAAVRALAFRAAGALGRADLAGELRGAWGSDDEAERFWSAWAGALLGARGADEALWSVAGRSGALAEEAADCAARVSPPGEARRRIEALMRSPGLGRVCLVAAGALGDPALLPWVLDRLTVAPLARLAGEALSRITGAPIEGALRGAPAPGFDAGPSDDPRDTSVKMDPDTQLPWPHGANARALWAAHRGRFAPGVRHVDGRPLDEGGLDRVLRLGGQRRRAGAAFERAARAPGRPLFDVAARVERQRAALGASP